jgi:hypothetical protein
MYSRHTRPKQNSLNPAHTTTPSRFAAPTSFVQPQVEPLTPEQEQASKEEIEKIKAAGSNWPDVSMFTTNRPVPAPPPRIQRKRDTAKTGNKDAQAPSESSEINQSNIIKLVKNSVPQLRDYMASDKTDDDPSLLSDAEIRATEEYRYLEQKFVSSPSEKPENIYSQEEILLACRLALRYMRQTQIFISLQNLDSFLLKAHRQLNVAKEAQNMVGKKMTWVSSDRGLGFTFDRWARANTEEEAPKVDSSTRLNCWEMILLAAYRAGMINWKWIHDTYTADAESWLDYLIEKLSGSSRIKYEIGNPRTPKPLKGDIVFFGSGNHIALANGITEFKKSKRNDSKWFDKVERHSQVISFWPPPNTPFTDPDIDVGTLDEVKITTIEDLDEYMVRNEYEPRIIEFASAPW